MKFLFAINVALAIISIIMIIIGDSTLIKGIYALLLIISIGAAIHFWKHRTTT